MKRNIYLENMPIDEALKRFTDTLKPHMKFENESIKVVDALDRVSAEAVFAQLNSPLYDSAAMDGIAVISLNTHGANEAEPLVLKRGSDYVPVDTGDPIVPPFDAVIMVEDIHEADKESSIIRSAASSWQHVRPVGEDIVQGEMLLPKGHKIRPIDIGVLLAGGHTDVLVRKLPTVAIIPTGTELIEPGVTPKQGDIIDSNSWMLEALVKKCGGVPTRFKLVDDEYNVIRNTLHEASLKYDIVMIIAGTSAGREDYTPQALKELGEVVVHGVAVKPGKPVIMAILNGKPIIGIPGYPVSAYLTFENFVAPVLNMFSGFNQDKPPAVKATVTRRLVSSLKHSEFVRVKVGRIGNKLVATPLARGAGAAMSLVRADGFCVIGRDSEGVEAGSEVDVILNRDLDGLDKTLVSIGSHDLILDLLADMLGSESGLHLSSTHVGSMGGLMALKNSETHIAPIHLLDEATGTYNTEVVKKLFPDKKMALIKGVGRIQGIMVKKSNPLRISGVADLCKCRYINRQRGAGTRVLFDYLLKQAGIESLAIPNYGREAATHMAVAATIKNGSADAGMGIFSAASAMGLDFIPLGNEDFDFAIPADFLDLWHIKALIEALKNPAFHKKLDELGGYTHENCGETTVLTGPIPTTPCSPCPDKGQNLDSVTLLQL